MIRLYCLGSFTCFDSPRCPSVKVLSIRVCWCWCPWEGWYRPLSPSLSQEHLYSQSVGPSPHTDSHWQFSLKTLTNGKVWTTGSISEVSFLGKNKLPMRQLRTVSHGSSCFSWLGTLNLTLIALQKKYQSESQSASAGRRGRMDVCEEIFAGNKTTFTRGNRRRRRRPIIMMMMTATPLQQFVNDFLFSILEKFN